MVLVGVETIGDPRSVEARQAITMLVNEKGFWSEPIRISEPGIVYFPAFTVDGAGKVWIAWSEFKANVWHIMARTWERGKLGAAVEVSSAAAVNLQPAIAALPSGEVYVAWQAAGDRFQIRGRAYRDGRWQSPEILAPGNEQSFRPVLAVDSSGALWLAWDRASGSRYETVAKVRDGSRVVEGDGAVRRAVDARGGDACRWLGARLDTGLGQARRSGSRRSALCALGGAGQVRRRRAVLRDRS